jgi:hypothetical protein
MACSVRCQFRTAAEAKRAFPDLSCISRPAAVFFPGSRQKPAALILIARPPRPDLALALLQIGAQLRRQAFHPVGFAFGLALFGSGHRRILTSANEN